MTRPKVTILPPAKQDVFFQEQQFDEALSGEDPIRFTNFRRHGQTSSLEAERKARGGNEGLAKSKKKKLRNAAQELEGHENKEAILKILRSE